MREIHLNNGLKIEIAEDNCLRGVDLQGLDLSGVDLSNTEFIQGKAGPCKLNRTNLRNSNLRSCVFKEALIDEVDFSRAGLSGSTFFWTLEVHNCDFSGAVMSRVAFHTVVLNSQFIGIENADLNLFHGALTECDLSGSLEISLIEGSFSNSRFENVLFKNSSFHDSVISGNTFKNVEFRNAVVWGNEFEDNQFFDCRFIGCFFEESSAGALIPHATLIEDCYVLEEDFEPMRLALADRGLQIVAQKNIPSAENLDENIENWLDSLEEDAVIQFSIKTTV
jgi:uncharacterized protein YjbI with pentapeptide repeats